MTRDCSTDGLPVAASRLEELAERDEQGKATNQEQRCAVRPFASRFAWPTISSTATVRRIPAVKASSPINQDCEAVVGDEEQHDGDCVAAVG